MPRELGLRYGANPHQRPARAFTSGELPFTVRNGAPGYINLLDALNAWQLVRELRHATSLAAAASFKHVSPAGAAVAVPLGDALARSLSIERTGLTPLATAYARARGADRVSSFGDVAAFSEAVDEATARMVRREVSDGCIAPGYDPKALEILSRKKGGAYLVLEVDPTYTPGPTETRDLFRYAASRSAAKAVSGPASRPRRGKKSAPPSAPQSSNTFKKSLCTRSGVIRNCGSAGRNSGTPSRYPVSRAICTVRFMARPTTTTSRSAARSTTPSCSMTPACSTKTACATKMNL